MKNIARYIDHTLLNPFASLNDLDQIVTECIEYNFHSLCVSPWHACSVYSMLKEHETQICTVIGFPHGNSLTSSKVAQIEALYPVVDEFDVVINLQALFSGADVEEIQSNLRKEIAQITDKVHEFDKIVKFIIESSRLEKSHLSLLCNIFNDSAVDFVKTSTGFNGSGAQIKDVTYLRSNLRKDIKIKASGGIKTFEQAQSFIEIGADRLGCSSSVNIVKEQK